MTTQPAPQTCSSPAGSPALPTGMCRRDLLVAVGALLMTGGAAASAPTPEAFLFEDKWTFGSDADMAPMAGEDSCTRFGLVHFGRPSAKPPQPDPGGNPQSGWQACSDLIALARTSDVLFLSGMGTGRTRSREAIARSASGLVVDLRAGSQPDARSPAKGCLEETAASDFVRAYVQQVVAFDLEDAHAALYGHTPCQVAVSVCSGEKSAITASIAAAARVCSAGHGAVRGQLLLLTFGSPTGCLRLSKEAFKASMANLPGNATSLHAVTIDTRLPPDAVRATVLTEFL